MENRLRLVASGDGRDGALTVHLDAELYLAQLTAGQPLRHASRPGRHAWLQVLRGAATLNGVPLAAGDGAAISAAPELVLAGAAAAEVLLFDLA